MVSEWIIQNGFYFLLLLPLFWALISDIKIREIDDLTHMVIICMALGYNLIVFGLDGVIYSLMFGGLLYLIFRFMPFDLTKWVGGGDLKLLISMGFVFTFEQWVYWLMFSCISGIIHCLIRKDKGIPFAVDMFIGYVVIIILFLLGVLN